MNDQDPDNIYDTVQKERVYEFPYEPAENEGALNDAIREDWRSENNVYATKLETHEYDSVSVCAVEDEENTLASSPPEADGYLLPEEVYPEPQDLPPGEPQEDRDISMEELHSPTQDQEPSPEEPQENGNTVKEDVPTAAFFTIQESSEDTPTCYSAADGLQENESASTNPEIHLFVKVRAACDRHTCACRLHTWCFVWF